MKFLTMIKNFKNDESGAVTVDWVVLTAAVVGLGLIVINAVTPEIETAGTTIATDLANATALGREAAEE
ncbi:Flp family type IVb pilin [Pseudorhodobacter sp. MZDSW-24AT]|uniref:Flp family type IVb pilin n=1 Tax=Pseudorhodobacter sp. MZDSW-24AT TaxID=2052957 RepID=UPI000C1F1E25|nr:pilus assembly protein [Pseudorhodobacter sp. MZDSW-24AT]PJF09074.1 pilus assembly protein [Pseudorhodobacter sp. MZDSW-24AT]